MKHIKNRYALFFTLAVSACVIMSVSINDLKRIKRISSLEVMYRIANIDKNGGDPVDRFTLVSMTRKGQSEHRRIKQKKIESGTARDFEHILPLDESEYEEIGLNDIFVPNTKIIEIDLRSHPLGFCKVIFADEKFEGYFSRYVSSMGGGHLATFPDPLFTFFDADDCRRSPYPFSGAIVRSESQQSEAFLIASKDYIRKSGIVFFEDYFSDLGKPRTVPELYEYIRKSKNISTTFFTFSKENYIISVDSLSQSLRDEARSATGKRYRRNDVEEAITDIFSYYNGKISWGGLSADNSLIIPIMPWIIIFVIYPLFRMLDTQEITFDDYWVLQDVSTKYAKFIAMLYCFSPVALSAFFVVTYFSATNVKWFIFGTVFEFNLDLLPHIYRPVGPGWVKGNTHSENIGGFICWIILIVAIYTSKRMLSIYKKSVTRQIYLE